MWALAALLLTALVLVPLVWIFASSLQSDATNQWTLANYVEGFSRSIYLEPVRNSLVLASVVAVSAVVVGTLLAWAVSRTDMPGRELIRSLVFAAFVTPSFLGAIAWIFLAAPNSGWLNRAWAGLTGAGWAKADDEMTSDAAMVAITVRIDEGIGINVTG